ncbi:MAG: HAD family phosphatase [Burkholderiaceae bacterium]
MTTRPLDTAARAPVTGQPPVRLVIFDLGGVLLNIDFDRSFRIWGDAAGIDPQLLRRRYAIDDAYRRHERGQIDAHAYFAALAERLSITLPYETWLQGWNALLLDEVPGIRARISRARRAGRVCVFSNTNAAHAQVWMGTHAAMLGLFDKVFTSSDLGLRKPEPEAFAAVLAAMGATAAQALFFDDTEENIDGARRVGLRAVRVRCPADIDSALDDLGL